jgi:hypothetical protein
LVWKKTVTSAVAFAALALIAFMMSGPATPLILFVIVVAALLI